MTFHEECRRKRLEYLLEKYAYEDYCCAQHYMGEEAYDYGLRQKNLARKEIQSIALSLFLPDSYEDELFRELEHYYLY
jgi:hypothetical protein